MYKVLYDKKVVKQISKLDNSVKKIIKNWITKNLVYTENPRQHRKSLTSNLQGIWRYRIGDYRLLADIRDDELVIVAISIAHRREVYK